MSEIELRRPAKARQEDTNTQLRLSEMQHDRIGSNLGGAIDGGTVCILGASGYNNSKGSSPMFHPTAICYQRLWGFVWDNAFID